MNSNNAAGGALDQLRGVLRECDKGASGFDHNCLSKIKSVWPRYGVDANYLLLARWPGSGIGVRKILDGAKRGRQGIETHDGAQRCGRLFEVKNRPRANPVGGWGVGGNRGSRNLVAMGDLDCRDDIALVLRHPILTV
jgi:hypothetical protein